MFPSIYIYIKGKCTYTYKHGICTLYSYIYIYAGKKYRFKRICVYVYVYIYIYFYLYVSRETFYIQRPIIVSIIVYDFVLRFFQASYNCIFYISIAIIVFILCCLCRFLPFFTVKILLFFVYFLQDICYNCILYIQLYRCIYNCIYMLIHILSTLSTSIIVYNCL